MQILPETNVAELFDRLVADQVPGRRGLEAWASLLRAHATLIRQLDTDLEPRPRHPGRRDPPRVRGAGGDAGQRARGHRERGLVGGLDER